MEDSMDKRYQVFISSTYVDLQEERKEVMQALLEQDCIPAGMELFPASNDDQWTLIKKVIDDCDYYILILAGRYGSMDSEGMGYTEKEYRYAIETGKPVIAFLHKNPDNIITSKSEKTPEGIEKLGAFRELAQTKMTKYWTDSHDLGSVVSRSMIRLIRDYPAIGWVKADNISDENTMIELLKLQKENNELKKQIANLKVDAPEGANKFAQGDDVVDITYCIHYTDKSDKKWFHDYAYNYTWNELFSELSPYLVSECDEVSLLKVLKELIRNSEGYSEDIKLFRKENDVKKITLTEIKINSFQIIKVQLQALGLIQKSIKNRSVKDKLTYWKLTPYGEHVMIQLIAIKKEN
jgi:hypothetical protein